jgi:hypothetical protein
VKVVDLMEVRRRSLSSISRDKKKPAKAALQARTKAKARGKRSVPRRKAAAG